jgi:hypothetical protein
VKMEPHSVPEPCESTRCTIRRYMKDAWDVRWEVERCRGGGEAGSAS